MPATFTRMDESTAEQWVVIGARDVGQPGSGRRPDARPAALARRDHRRLRHRPAHPLPADGHAWPSGPAPTTRSCSPRCCHDIGKAISVPNHPAIAAEMIRPYVRDEVYEMIRVHQDFQGRHYYAHFGGDPDARETAPRRAPPTSGCWPSASPTSGTRWPSTPTTTRSRSSTSSRWCGRSRPRPACRTGASAGPRRFPGQPSPSGATLCIA